MAPQPQNLRSPKPPQASHVSPLPISSITAQSSTHGRASQSKNRYAITPELVHDTSLNCRSQSHALPSCHDSSLPIRHLLTATPPTTSYSRRSPLPPLLSSLRAPITTNHNHHISTFALVCDEDCILDLFFEEIVFFDLLISCWEISGHGACACGVMIQGSCIPPSSNGFGTGSWVQPWSGEKRAAWSVVLELGREEK
ncbi:hypothetical protein M0R45_021221 [Rubus argutus]|uniref:Uncharacterized protein n=1 Tax=Rubus argutus TaxID=59490 RepID=A0AAW1XD22_RUBAR